MKDNVITLENGIQYYVLNEIDHNGRRFILGIEVDNINDKVKESYCILEVTSQNDKLVMGNITDSTLKSEVENIFFTQLESLK